MKNDYTRFEFYLSYWFFCWGVIYIILNWCFQNGFVSSSYIAFFIRNCNPLIAVIVALIYSIFALLVLIYKKAKPIVIFLYTLLVIIVIKVIPIVLLWRMPFRPIQNIISIVIVIVLYELYLRTNGHNIAEFYKNEIANIMKGNTPVIHTILTIWNK